MGKAASTRPDPRLIDGWLSVVRSGWIVLVVEREARLACLHCLARLSLYYRLSARAALIGPVGRGSARKCELGKARWKFSSQALWRCTTHRPPIPEMEATGTGPSRFPHVLGPLSTCPAITRRSPSLAQSAGLGTCLVCIDAGSADTFGPERGTGQARAKGANCPAQTVAVNMAGKLPQLWGVCSGDDAAPTRAKETPGQQFARPTRESRVAATTPCPRSLLASLPRRGANYPHSSARSVADRAATDPSLEQPRLNQQIPDRCRCARSVAMLPRRRRTRAEGTSCPVRPPIKSSAGSSDEWRHGPRQLPHPARIVTGGECQCPGRPLVPATQTSVRVWPCKQGGLTRRSLKCPTVTCRQRVKQAQGTAYAGPEHAGLWFHVSILNAVRGIGAEGMGWLEH